MYVDESELARLVPGSQDPARDLARAVTRVVDASRGRDMFARMSGLESKWRVSAEEGPPPTLPLLALSVLAGTRMRRDGDARASNYYLRFAQSLLPERGIDEVQAVRLALREGGAFADVAEMWRTLHIWISQQSPALGISMIRDHPRLKRIGFPLSQAVLRGSDRAVLTKLFAALDIKALGVPEESALLEYLRLWSARPRGFSETFLRALSETDLGALLGSLVYELALSWDGRIRTDDGRQRLELQVGLDLDEWKSEWMLSTESGPDFAILSGRMGSVAVELLAAAEVGNPFYVIEDAPAVVGSALSKGISLKTEGFAAELAATPIMFFRRSALTGTWLSVGSLVPFEEHIVAVDPELAAQMKRLFDQAADPSVRPIRQSPGSALIDGFAMFQRVRFEDKDRLDAALEAFPALRNVGMAPEVAVRPRLVRGLKLATHVTRACYLMGGEPDLLLPVGLGHRIVDVTLDGILQRFTATGFPIELRRIGPLGVGTHVLIADGSRLEFSVLDAEPYQRSAEISVRLAEGREDVSSGRTQPGSGALPRAALARRGRDETWLLHAGGRAERIEEPTTPKFLENLGVNTSYFEVSTSPSVQWLAQRRREAWKLTPTDSSERPTFSVHFDVPGVWRQVWAHESGAALWDWHLQSSGTR
jgi:hypothetical protein